MLRIVLYLVLSAYECYKYSTVRVQYEYTGGEVRYLYSYWTDGKEEREGKWEMGKRDKEEKAGRVLQCCTEYGAVHTHVIYALYRIVLYCMASYRIIFASSLDLT